MINQYELTISNLTQADTLSVNQLFEASITDAFEQESLGHFQNDIQLEIENKKRLVERALDPTITDIHFLLAKINEVVVGTISYKPCGEDIRICTENGLDDVGELGSLYVLPSYQNRRIGSALIKGMVTFLKKQGIDEFCLDSGYKRAQERWVRKFGEPYKTVKDYWGPGSIHMVWLCKVNK
ncbi:GNAT family N-acetyltransferase [Paenibacillus sp. 19GGS1-52]|uniref:GNAT family N-acetyltransferase n=1 Tax=Paenibacillus sp. 19GGS1-52 TaxID=2758563 RepID=UPI001EFB00D8|nr:GNAT family N-acetyltransferase [Paenibacillus sp. 19GGS1-52]ULO09587.1 GNAT family N-acetyltransferase [Paenibacillus sp. 19GGS1-52]